MELLGLEGSATELANAVKEELGCDDFRNYILKQKLDSRAFASLRVERLERFCTYDEQGRPSEQITEGDLSKLEAFHNRLKLKKDEGGSGMVASAEAMMKATMNMAPEGATASHGSGQMQDQQQDQQRCASNGNARKRGKRQRDDDNILGKRVLPEDVAGLTPEVLFKRMLRCDDLSPIIGRPSCEDLRRLYGILRDNLVSELKPLSDDQFKSFSFSTPLGRQIRDEVCEKTLNETQNGRLRIAGRTFNWPLKCMHETLVTMRGTIKRDPEKQEEKRLAGMIATAEGASRSSLKREPLTLDACVRLWGVTDDMKGKSKPLNVGTGIVRDYDDKELNVELQSVEYLEDDFVNLGQGRDILVSELQEGTTVPWPNRLCAWSWYVDIPVSQAMQSGLSSRPSNTHGTGRGSKSGASKQKVEEEEVTSPKTTVNKRPRCAPEGSTSNDDSLRAGPSKTPSATNEASKTALGKESFSSGNRRGEAIDRQQEIKDFDSPPSHGDNAPSIGDYPHPNNVVPTPTLNPQPCDAADLSEESSARQTSASGTDQGSTPGTIGAGAGGAASFHDPPFPAAKNLRIELLYKQHHFATGTIRNFDERNMVVQILNVKPGMTGKVEDADDGGATKRLEDVVSGDRIFWPRHGAETHRRGWRPEKRPSAEVGDCVVPFEGSDLTADVGRTEQKKRRLYKLAETPTSLPVATPEENNKNEENVPTFEKAPHNNDSAPLPNNSPPAPNPPPAANPPAGPAVPPRESYQRAKAVRPGTWRKGMHKADCPDPRNCSGCGRLAQEGKGITDTEEEDSNTQVDRSDDQERPTEDQSEGAKWKMSDAWKINNSLICAVAFKLPTVNEVHSMFNRSTLLDYITATKFYKNTRIKSCDYEQLLAFLADYFLRANFVELTERADDLRVKLIPRRAMKLLKEPPTVQAVYKAYKK